MAKTAQALTLSTTDFDRPPVVIDGETYYMRAGEEFSVGMMRELNRIVSRLRILERGDGTESEDEAAEIVNALDTETTAQVQLVMVDLPAEVCERLSLPQRAQILRTFMGLVSNDTPTS